MPAPSLDIVLGFIQAALRTADAPLAELRQLEAYYWSFADEEFPAQDPRWAPIHDLLQDLEYYDPTLQAHQAGLFDTEELRRRLATALSGV